MILIFVFTLASQAFELTPIQVFMVALVIIILASYLAERMNEVRMQRRRSCVGKSGYFSISAPHRKLHRPSYPTSGSGNKGSGSAEDRVR
jgi:hypothetical protein